MSYLLWFAHLIEMRKAEFKRCGLKMTLEERQLLLSSFGLFRGLFTDKDWKIFFDSYSFE